MPFVPITNGIKVEELFTFDGGQDAAMVWGVELDVGDLDLTLATQINADFDAFHGHTTSGLSLDGLRSTKSTRTTRIITDVRDAEAPQFTFFPNAAGTNTGDPLPLGSSVVIKLTGGLRGRSHRGRKYFPHFTEPSNTNDSKIESGAVSVTANAAAFLITTLAGHTTPLAILSRKLGEAQEVLHASVDGIWHYQRRRAR